jgi:hypothetical protein
MDNLAQYQELTKTLSEKYDNLLTAYIQAYSKYRADGQIYPLPEELCFMLSNLKYIERYLEIVKNKNDIEAQVEKLNFLKEFDDVLFQPKEQVPLVSNPKIEIC